MCASVTLLLVVSCGGSYDSQVPNIVPHPAPRSRLRNIALTVHELEAGEFYWVLMEAVDDVGEDDALAYIPMESASDPYASYSNALVSGLAAMRRLVGPEGARR